MEEILLKDLISICNLLHLEFFTNLAKCAHTILTNLYDITFLKGELSDVSDPEDAYPLETQTIASLPNVRNKSEKAVLCSHVPAQTAVIQQAENNFNFLRFVGYS
ncbi:hypothetical protein NPIL_4001 [Nephila pilipes]|uniref:Uncharacterized protein n=1 Tax=Nephila pilipes TaxID=299642 RepID=A0A8X6NW45_NEPPI|nr:hypothetical protein NPIL_4001 [Nephila pilipes]